MDILTSGEIAVSGPRLGSKGNRLGRPPGKAVSIKRKKGKVGRPAGEVGRLAEFKARLMGTTGERIIQTLISKAMDSEDKDQFLALKFCAERILPMSAFDAVKGSNTAPVVSINISGFSAKPVIDDVTDIEANG